MIPLHDYQTVAKNFMITHPKSGLFLDVGLGKTATTLEALMELASYGMISGHILIIAPKAIARSTWIDEMHKWGINANVVSLIVNEKGKQLSKAKRLELYENIETQLPSFYFINKEMVTDLVSWHSKNKKSWPFPTVIIDELQSFKSHSSKRFDALKAVSPYITRFIGLTGTPVPNGLLDLWAEIYLMDGGERLGKGITAYKYKYFNPGLVIDNVVVSWNPKRGAEEEIYDKISDIVMSIKNPGIKLPEVTYNNVICHMDEKEMKIYKQMMKENVIEAEKDGETMQVEAVNAAVLTAKLSQMASGTLYVGDTDDYIVIHEHKQEQLEYIINNTNSPVLVAYHFKSDKKEITRYLTERGYDVRLFDGSPEMIHEWNKGQIPIMLLQPMSAGHGINIQDGGHTLVWYTIPWSLEAYIQTCGRLNRQGQKHPVVIHHLITEGTIDRHILNAINKKDLSEKALLDAVATCLS